MGNSTDKAICKVTSRIVFKVVILIKLIKFVDFIKVSLD